MILGGVLWHGFEIRDSIIFFVLEIESVGTNDDSTLLDLSLVGNTPGSSTISSNWSSIEYEELKSENELFKQELPIS